MTFDRERLRRVLDRDEIRWLIERARQRLERGQPLTGSVTLNDATEQQRRAIELLLGRPPGKGKSIAVPLEEIDVQVRRSEIHPDGLAGAVEVLTGPVIIRAQARAAAEEAWLNALLPLDALISSRAEFSDWFVDSRTIAALRRQPALAAEAAKVLFHLPADGMPLSKLANLATGDAHALDVGRPLATFALSAIRSTWWSGDQEFGTPAQRRRLLWDTAGVIVDELSSTVLVLNLRAVAGSRLHAFTAEATGEPVVLTLRQIDRHEVQLHPSQLFVCENPVVVAAAADQLGAESPTLVCVNGQPTTAAVRLLESAHACGAQILYHGDFDWGGVRIANLLGKRIPWQTWRYDRHAYEAAAEKGSRRPLSGKTAVATWDYSLSDLMQSRGVRIEEEDVIDDLVTDLATAGRAP